MYYKELLALVNNKQLELYWILAPQRSFSTAIAIALSQADTIHQLLSEPFYYNDLENRPYDVDCEKANQEKFERGCDSLLTAYKKYAEPEQQAPGRAGVPEGEADGSAESSSSSSSPLGLAGLDLLGLGD